MPKKRSKNQSKDIYMPSQSNPNFQRAKKSDLTARTNQKKAKKIKSKKK